MPHPYCSISHGRPVCTAKHILPLFVLLGGMPAFAAAETASPDPKTTQPASTIPEPSPLLRDQTRAMTESCRAWLPTTLPAMREGEKGLPPSVQLSSETRHQRDLCAMAIEPDQVERSLLLLTMGAAWGLLLRALLEIRCDRFSRGFARDSKAGCGRQHNEAAWPELHARRNAIRLI